MRIGLVEFLLILAIASLTIGPQVALFVDRWMRRANRANARAARRRAEYAAQMAVERDALLKRFRTASTVFGVCILLALVYALVFRPIDTPPQGYTAPDVRQDTGAAQTALAADHKGTLDLGEYQGVDCIRTQDGLVYAAAYDGAALKKRTSDLVRTDGGHDAAILSVDGELTGFAFDGSGDLWLSILTPGGGSLCRAAHDSWGTAVEQVVTQIDGAPLGAVSAVEAAPDGRIYFAVAASASAADGLESTLRTELLAHTGTGCVYVYDPAARTVQKVLVTMGPQHALPVRGIRPVAAIAPGVSGSTGLTLCQLAGAMVEAVRPAALICVDSLCSTEGARLGRSIQFSDTGLHPAQADHARHLDAGMLGVPVVAAGIPTLMEAEEGADLVVTPRALDSVIAHGSALLAAAINRALQPRLSVAQLCWLTG